MSKYISHIVMANEVYNSLKDNDINLDYMLTFSLGGDLSNFSKCRHICHNKKKEEFFDNMKSYLKKNNLENDKELIGVLYGHICHYALDDCIHPLVRKMCKKCKNNKKNHSFIEEYYDEYLINKKYKIDLFKYKKETKLKGRMTKKISKMINYAYKKTYNEKHISIYYKFNLFLYKSIRYLISFNKLIKKLSKYNKFLITNKDIDLLNKKEKANFDNLYKESIKKATNTIRIIK